MTLVVVDTNVLISSFFGGNPGKVLDLWFEGSITLCLTNEIVDEYVRVLVRTGKIESDRVLAMVELFQEQHNVAFTSRTPSIKACEDPDDDKFIAAAVALGAAWIVSGDKHLLSMGEYMGIKIRDPKTFLFELSATST